MHPNCRGLSHCQEPPLPRHRPFAQPVRGIDMHVVGTTCVSLSAIDRLSDSRVASFPNVVPKYAR